MKSLFYIEDIKAGILLYMPPCLRIYVCTCLVINVTVVCVYVCVHVQLRIGLYAMEYNYRLSSWIKMVQIRVRVR